jgi:restriction endonuclease S subunit
MAVWSIIQFSQLVDLRLDSEYYQPINLKLEKSLKAAKPIPISNFAYVTDGIHGSPDWVEENGILYLSAKCVKDNYFSLANAGKISQSQNTLNPRTQARLDDVLLTTVGTIGNAAVVDEKILPANMDRHLGIIRIDKESCINPYYLATFLNSKFGIFQTIRESTGNVQLNLFIEKIKNLLVPIGDRFNDVGKLTRKAYDKRYESESLYAEAEALLLHELGLDNLDLSTQKTYVANFSETVEGDRLDAEYFQPKYYRVLDAIKSTKPKEIIPFGILLDSITNGQTPLHHDLSQGDITFLTAEHIFDFRINYDSEKRVLNEHHQNKLKKTQLQENDILITIKGRVGNAAVVKNLSKSVNINQDVALLRLQEKYHPYYISGFINSIFGKALTEQISTGQINPFLGLGKLQQLPIPIFETSCMDRIGEKIQQKVNEAFQMQQEAENLLEQAKHRVEQMILGEENLKNDYST